MTIDEIIDNIIKVEGGYTNDPNDAGGATRYGITVAVARRNGYNGDMRDLPIEFARMVYRKQYYEGPHFDDVAKLSPRIAEELTDTGVNMGVTTAALFLQRWLNVMNMEKRFYPDVKADGYIGQQTLACLEAYLKKRGKEGETVLLRALNSSQGHRYLEIAEGRQANENYVYGWLLNRVS